MPITITNRFSLALVVAFWAVSLFALMVSPVHYVKACGLLIGFIKGVAVHLVQMRVISYLLNRYAGLLFNDQWGIRADLIRIAVLFYLLPCLGGSGWRVPIGCASCLEAVDEAGLCT